MNSIDKIIKSGKKNITIEKIINNKPEGNVEITNEKTEKKTTTSIKDGQITGNTSVESKKNKIAMIKTEDNKTKVIIEKKNSSGSIEKIIEVENYINNILEGAAIIQDLKKKETIQTTFINGKMHGNTIKTNEKTTSQLVYKNGVKDGKFTIINHKDNSKIHGTFKNDLLYKKVTSKRKFTSSSVKFDKNGKPKVSNFIINILKTPFIVIKNIIQFILNYLKLIITYFIPYKILGKVLYSIKNLFINIYRYILSIFKK